MAVVLSVSVLLGRRGGAEDVLILRESPTPPDHGEGGGREGGCGGGRHRAAVPLLRDQPVAKSRSESVAGGQSASVVFPVPAAPVTPTRRGRLATLTRSGRRPPCSLRSPPLRAGVARGRRVSRARRACRGACASSPGPRRLRSAPPRSTSPAPAGPRGRAPGARRSEPWPAR